MSSLKVRYATAEDYQGVLAIDNTVMAGGDYLPARYMSFIQDPCTTCYVLEVDQTVVSNKLNVFTMKHIVGKTNLVCCNIKVGVQCLL